MRNYKKLLLYLGEQERIVIEDPDETILQTNQNPDYILNLLNYTKLLNQTTLPKGNHYLQIIQDTQLATYFDYVQQNKLKEALCHIVRLLRQRIFYSGYILFYV